MSPLTNVTNYLQGLSVGANESVSSLNKSLLVACYSSDLDDVTKDLVVEDLEGLRKWNRTREEFDQITGYCCQQACWT